MNYSTNIGWDIKQQKIFLRTMYVNLAKISKYVGEDTNINSKKFKQDPSKRPLNEKTVNVEIFYTKLWAPVEKADNDKSSVIHSYISLPFI